MNAAGSAALPLLERRAELRALDDVITSAARGAGRHVVIEGEAGIGKSSLLGTAADRATLEGLRALRTRASELERHYPYGVALGLFGRLVRELGGPGSVLFADAASAAGPLFTPDRTGLPDTPGDPFATIHGLYWLSLNAAEREPIALFVDDAQWADVASLRFLNYLAQRVGELPIALVTAFRTGEGGVGDDLAEALRNVPDAVRLALAPLSEEAVGELLMALDPAADASATRAVFEATRGNPFFVIEVGRDRRDRGASDAAPVPESVARYVEGRISRLDPTAHRVAEAIAILGEEADLRRVGRLGGTDDRQTVLVVRELARVGIVDPSGALAFVHPLVRAAVYAGIPDVARGRLHRHAGILLADDGSPFGVVAGQLLEAERTGDPRVVEMLRRAADEAVLHGEPRVAVTLLTRALEEPPTADQRPELLIALARAEALVASPSAVDRFRMVLEEIVDRRRRAELLLELGHALINSARWNDATETFERGIRELRPDGRDPDPVDQELHDRLEAGFVASAWVGFERFAEAEHIVDRILGERTLGRVHRELAVWSAFQRSTVVASTAAEQAKVVRRAIADVPIAQLIHEGQLVEVASGVLVTTDDLELQLDLLARATDAAERAGAFGKVGVYLYCRAWPLYYTGRLTEAIADAQASLRVAELGWETFVPATRAALAMALIDRGELAAAADAVDIDPQQWTGRIDYAVLIPLARGRLALAHGKAEEALELFREAGRVPTEIGMRLLMPTEWRIWMIVALARLGQRVEARSQAEQTVAIAREWGARWTLGCALRAAAIADGGPDGIGMFRDAVSLLEESPAHLERTRTLVDFGAALRRLGRLREAREVLRTAMDSAHQLGARTLLEQSRQELQAAGSRPRRYALSGVEALTPAELRVARLAAEGRTNREIAQALFVTPKAVEYHLANTYPKLRITSRRELGPALELGGPPG